jgi:hypothetical protein
MHVSLVKHSPPFAVVAGWTGCNQVIPAMFPSQPAWNNMVDGKLVCSVPTILAGVIIPPQYFSFIQFNPDPWSLNHSF